MITAVYVVSSGDKVTAFADASHATEYDGKAVHVGNVSEDVRSVVFADGSPAALKRAIANGEPFEEALRAFGNRIGSLLAFLHVGSETLRVFVHFGGQGEDEVRRFNDGLGRAPTDAGASRFYAISFGNRQPDALFPGGVFTPPHGKSFEEMCNGLRSGGEDDFEHIRALRLLLSCAVPNGKGEYDVGFAWLKMWDLNAAKMSNVERHFITDNSAIDGLLHVNDKGYLSFVRTMIGAEDFQRLLSILERTEVKK